MKFIKTSYPWIFFPGIFVALLVCLTLLSSCQKAAQITSQSNSYGPPVNVVYLVSDDPMNPASRTDTNLVDGWGIAINPNGKIWVASSMKGLSTIYDGTGSTVLSPVIVTSATNGTRGKPTGIVYNSTTDFVIPSTGTPARFIFTGLDGSVTAWNSGDSTKTVATKTGANYTGLTLANDGTGNFLYAANYSQGTIDVLDKNFNFVTGRPFTDPSLPQGYTPYNVQVIGNVLYVTYTPTGNGNGNNPSGGYVNIFNPDGTFVKRFASGGTLESPWGVVQAPAALGLGQNMILVGNFLFGTINIYDANGIYKGDVSSQGVPIVIPGLWGLVTAPASAPGLDPDAVYFAGGPEFHTHGIFGYFKKK